MLGRWFSPDKNPAKINLTAGFLPPRHPHPENGKFRKVGVTYMTAFGCLEAWAREETQAGEGQSRLERL